MTRPGVGFPRCDARARSSAFATGYGPTWFFDDDGSLVFSGRVPPEHADTVLAMITNARAALDAVPDGSEGGAAMTNIAGSFYDFSAERCAGTTSEVLTAPPDSWGGRAAVDWMTKLATDPSFDPQADHLAALSEAIDQIYAAAPAGSIAVRDRTSRPIILG